MIYLCVTTIQAPAAQVIARKLVEEKLAACANILSRAQSTYFWKGKLCEEEEELVLFKTSAAALDRFKERLKALHPYDCPELLVLPIADGFDSYFRWVEESTP